MKLCEIAWRNIWRNRRRAMITIASVFFAVFFCILMMGFHAGTWNKMVDNMLKTQTGHIQIHSKNYWDDRIIDNFMFMDDATIKQLENINNILNVSPRVETFAMAASGSVSKGVAIIGISPEKEAQKSKLPSRIITGDYLSENDDGIIIGEGLSKYLKISTGDTLALIGQGYHGASAVGLFPIRGILKLMTPEMENGLIYMTLSATQQFIDMPNGYSGILISISDDNRLNETIKEVESVVNCPHENSEMLNQVQHDSRNYSVYSWHFTMERLLQQAKTDKAFGVLLMYILYLIVGFGILGTVIMLTNERKREFCVMISIGMSRAKLSLVTVIELFAMSLIGIILALAVTIPVTHWFAAHPIKLSGEMVDLFLQYGIEPYLPMSTKPSIFTNQVITIFFIVLMTIIYPVRKIMKLNISKEK